MSTTSPGDPSARIRLGTATTRMATTRAAITTRPGRRRGKATSVLLVLPPPFEGFRHRHLVRPFQVGAHGDAHGDARDLHAEWLEQPREVDGGGLSFDGRAGGQD